MRKAIGVLSIGFLLFLLVGNAFYSAPFSPAYAAEYNTSFSHTRTEIYRDTGTSSNQWIRNSTCVTFFAAPSIVARFNYNTGGQGSGGNNCDSADIALLKSPINLQTVSGKMWETVLAWGFSSGAGFGTAIDRIHFFLRTNGTLPGFAENYGTPWTDRAVRFLLTICPSANTDCSTGSQTAWSARDTTKSLDEEGSGQVAIQSNDEIFSQSSIQSTNSFCLDTVAGACQNQFVLNFTGPTSQFGWTTGSSGVHTFTTSERGTGQLQQAQDYYLGVKVKWKTTVTPPASTWLDLVFGATSGATADSVGLWSVPASCVDPVNLAACTRSQNQTPTFDINPLDPSSWANAIIKGLVWAATEAFRALSFVFGMIADVFVIAMDAVGAFFGLGAVGTAIRSFLTGVANFIVNVVTTVFGWGITFASLFQNGISFIANFLSGSNGFITWIISFFTSIAGLWTIVQDVWNALNTAVFTMNQILVVWYLAGMFWVYMDGFAGFRNWIELTDMMVLKLIRGGWLVGREITQVVLDIKRFLAQWL